MSVESHHAKNEWLFYNRGNDIVANMVAIGDVVGKEKKKFIQFVAIFLLLKQGPTMIDFEAMNLLFEFLKVRHTPKKHWSDSVGWEIT